MREQIDIVYIHGAEIFATYDEYFEYLKHSQIKMTSTRKWNREYLQEELEGIANYYRPNMPRGNCNPYYPEWEVYFTKLLDKLNQNVILIGASLGAIFLAKYLSSHTIGKNILSLYLVASPYERENGAEEYIQRKFELQEKLKNIYNNTNTITLMFSKDDDCVLISDMDKYRQELPNANYEVYESKNGHFLLEEFPELLEMIKEDITNK